MLDSVEHFVGVGSIELLTKRFNNEEYFFKKVAENRDHIKDILDNPDKWREKLKGYEATLEESRQNMQNVITAIQILEHEKRSKK